ncbi:MAG: glycosyltransferase family 4 protein [Polyangia bacterium]
MSHTSTPACDPLRKRRIVFVANHPDTFLSHRLPVARGAAARGMEVHLAAPRIGRVERVIDAGIAYHEVEMDRSGASPHRDLATALALTALYRKLRPEIVHHVALKAAVYGSFAARAAAVPCAVNAITGLGWTFVARGPRASALRVASKALLRAALSAPRCSRTVFQNRDDRALFARCGIGDDELAATIFGSGVDSEVFRPGPEPDGEALVMMAGRMLWEKGAGDLVEAARMLRERGSRARFALVGEPDAGNRGSVPLERLASWDGEGIVEWWGRREHMEELVPRAHVFCLPSRYGEGVPRALIEAAACARPTVACDVPGCREIVRHGETGLLVPPGDPAALARALERLLSDRDLRRRMGEAGRELVEEKFEEKTVVEQTLGLYEQLLIA